MIDYVGDGYYISLVWKRRIARFYFPASVFLLAVCCIMCVNCKTFNSNEVVNCNDVYSVEGALNGTIKTLSYPKPYPKNRYCKVLLRGNQKHRVIIRFEDFYLHHPFGEHHRKHSSECDGLDKLQVYDGMDENSKLIGEYCGGERPLPLMSSGPHLFLLLTSYNSAKDHDGRGYSAKYFFVKNYGITSGKQLEEKCLFEYNSNVKKQGEITSPNPGGIYPTNTNCTYIFDGTFLERIYLKFHYFDLEGIEPCTKRSGSDYLEFSSLHGFDPCPARRCGRFTPQEIVSERSYFRVTFQSNDRLNGLGFSASYSFVTDEELPQWAFYLRSSSGGILSQLYLTMWMVLQYIAQKALNGKC